MPRAAQAECVRRARHAAHARFMRHATTILMRVAARYAALRRAHMRREKDAAQHVCAPSHGENGTRGAALQNGICRRSAAQCVAAKIFQKI